MTADIDSTIFEVAGYRKEGASFGYSRARGLHPLLATRAETGEVFHLGMRKGSANIERGAQRIVRKLVRRVRRAGSRDPVTLRANSGCLSKPVVRSRRDHGMAYSTTVNQGRWVRQTIENTAENASRAEPGLVAG